MTMSSFAARLARDEDGGPLVEVAILLPILILFLFGGVDFMNAMYQWNAAAKAVEIGARIAAVSDPIASGLASIADNALSSGVASGSPMPEFTIACDGGASACSCTSGACDGMGAYSADAMGFLVYGRAGNVGCMPPASQYFAGMCNLHPQSRLSMSRSFISKRVWATPGEVLGPYRRSQFRSMQLRPRRSFRSDSSSCRSPPSTYRR